MKQTLHHIRQHAMFVPAMIVPTAIMLIFSFFSLSAPLDSARVAGAFRLGIVNEDTGLTFPPLKVSERMLEGMAANLPFQVVNLDSSEAAAAALDKGDVAAVLAFPADFSKLVASGEPITLDVMNGNHLTLLETQFSGQLPGLLQANFSAGVLMLRDALAKGQLPDGTFPVTANVTTIHKAPNAATLVAPFVMTFTTWLAAFVGSMLLFFASKDAPKGTGKAMVRTVLPVVATGLGSFVLALTIASTAVGFGAMLSIWMTIWAGALVLSWVIGGLFAVVGPLALIVIIPTVFYQTAVGGAQIPLAAAPDWLQSIGAVVPFDALGATYRAVVLGGGEAFPTGLFALTGLLGLGLLWGGSLFIGTSKAS